MDILLSGDNGIAFREKDFGFIDPRLILDGLADNMFKIIKKESIKEYKNKYYHTISYYVVKRDDL
jgi:hypothetical protein